MTRARMSAVAVAIVPSLLLVACGGTASGAGGAADGQGESHAGRAPSPEAVAFAATMATREPGALTTVRAAPVTGWKGPGGRPFEVALRTAGARAGHTRSFGTIARATALRQRVPDIGQFPCASCHLGRRVLMKDERITDAHQNIKPVHPARLGATCSNCHAPDNVEMLAVKGGERVSLDHAYRLCGQCHFQQAEAWAAGGHGKRLDGWQGRRVVMGCADCHDPHRPAAEPRVPFRAPRIERPPASPR